LAESITLDKTEISLEATETATLLVTVLPELATDKSVEWSSSNEAVAVVDENGVVTAVAVGEATITATTVDDSNLSASCKVSVVPTLAVSIELDQTEASVEEKSDLQLTATILPEHTTNKEVAWSSSDKWVASVDNTGLVTMYSAGEVIITATTTDGTNLSATCHINVYSGIDGVEGDDVIVATVGDNIVVKNTQLGSVVNVYASNGALVASEEATDGSVVIEAPVKGVYVVKVGKQTVKVII
ncbi:MAG: Ig domain-containing protein, partial [Muribaculaceae bacterium]|nr:Ig domain-containing protein [Muribaculaceae bacterium]